MKKKNRDLRRLCKMARAWKNKHGVGMGGLLIDTLAYNFLNSTIDYDNRSYLYYDWMSRDFFKYLANEPDQERYAALGSGQHVKVKKKFQKKAKKAYELSLEAIEAGAEDSAHDKWKKIYGRPFPAKPENITEASEQRSVQTWRDTEEFIEDRFSIDIRYNLEIDCEVSQDGFMVRMLSEFLRRGLPLLTKKKLLFKMTSIDVPEPYELYWKILNRGEEAKRRDCIRGQIERDSGYKQKQEKTDFRGEHIVECYAVKNGIVVAKDRIHVPIKG